MNKQELSVLQPGEQVRFVDHYRDVSLDIPMGTMAQIPPDYKPPKVITEARGLWLYIGKPPCEIRVFISKLDCIDRV